MPTYKTAKKESKWYNAFLHCVIWRENHNRRRVSKQKRERVLKHLDYWRHRNRIEGWD